MKKYGKFEKRFDAAVGKQPKMKNLLLQTYFTSLFSLVLCVSLFFGTSYAWFTSEVTNTKNEIYVGTLKVGLHAKGGRDLTSSSNKLFNQNIRWEPGYTTLDTIQINNEGDLAFKYVLSFTDGSLTGGNAQNLGAVAKQFDIWTYDHRGTGAPSPASYAQITEEDGWVYVGTLEDVLNGKSVLSGELAAVGAQNNGTGTVANMLTEHTYTVALHMKESADADVIGSKISLNVKLIAYQMIGEADVFGQKDYDNIVSASGAEELTKALTAGEDVVLLNGITIGSADRCLTIKSGSLDGAGNSISYTGGKNSNGKPMGVLTASGGTIQNLKIKAGTNGSAVYVTKLDKDLVIVDCSFSGAKSFYMDGTQAAGCTMTFTDTYFENDIAYKNIVDHAYFDNCTFAQLVTPCGDTTMEGCTFGWESLDVSALESGEAITLLNCTYNGVLIERAVVQVTDGNLTIEGTDLLAVKGKSIVRK